MKIAIGQMNVVAGQINQNIQTMKTMIEEAKEKKADIIVFPEMCITGYLLADRYQDLEFLKKAVDAQEEIKHQSYGIGIVFGNILLDETIKGKDGRLARYNGALFYHEGKEVSRMNGEIRPTIKRLLPNYRIFDDSRYFLSGLEKDSNGKILEDGMPFLFKKDGQNYKIGIEICEDLWSENYAEDVTEKFLQEEVDVLLNLSSSPWTLNKEKSREKQIQRYATHEKFPTFVYVNATGMQNTGKNICLFDGGSTIYDTFGKVVCSCNDRFEQEFKIYDGQADLTISHGDKLLQSLIKACQEVDKQWFNSQLKWVVGLSGGLDSSVTSSLLVAALGNNRVIGYNMASQYNSDKTKDNARQTARNLGIELREGAIESLVDATIKTTQEYGYEKADEGLVLENIQARLRGHLLSTFASLENGVVVNNGNKVEVALGYCTLYGDSIGAFSPIGDCTKVQLFYLAKELNKYFDKEVVPKNLVPQKENDLESWEFLPSAELKDNQQDPMKWFYHDWLISKLVEYPCYGVDKIRKSYYDGSLFETEVGAWLIHYGLDDSLKFEADLDWVLKGMERAVFKRIQMPPVVLISRGAFGSDFREVQGKFE